MLKSLYLPPVSERRAQREPLYTFTEIAERLGTTTQRLRGLGMNHQGLTSVKSTPGGMQVRPDRPKFRLSTARAWWAAIPPHLKGTQ